MPRIAGTTSALLDDLYARLESVVAAARAEGRAKALNEIRSLVGGGLPVRRGPGRPKGSRNKVATAQPARKPRKRRRSSWAGLTPAEHLARVNAIRKGRGLPTKSE